MTSETLRIKSDLRRGDHKGNVEVMQDLIHEVSLSSHLSLTHEAVRPDR